MSDRTLTAEQRAAVDAPQRPARARRQRRQRQDERARRALRARRDRGRRRARADPRDHLHRPRGGRAARARPPRLVAAGERDAARESAGAFVSTFHGFCARLLRAHAVLVGLAARLHGARRRAGRGACARRPSTARSSAGSRGRRARARRGVRRRRAARARSTRSTTSCAAAASAPALPLPRRASARLAASARGGGARRARAVAGRRRATLGRLEACAARCRAGRAAAGDRELRCARRARARERRASYEAARGATRWPAPTLGARRRSLDQPAGGVRRALRGAQAPPRRGRLRRPRARGGRPAREHEEVARAVVASASSS